MAAIKSSRDGTLSLAPSLLLSASPHAHHAAPCPIVSLWRSLICICPGACPAAGPHVGAGVPPMAGVHDVLSAASIPPPWTCSAGELWALVLSDLSWDHCFIISSLTQHCSSRSISPPLSLTCYSSTAVLTPLSHAAIISFLHSSWMHSGRRSLMMQASSHHSTPPSLDRYLYKNVPTYRPISTSVSFYPLSPRLGGEFYWGCRGDPGESKWVKDRTSRRKWAESGAEVWLSESASETTGGSGPGCTLLNKFKWHKQRRHSETRTGGIWYLESKHR